ncbi:MAG: helix-turn-helix domain-containing protein [Maribacter sp.]
MTLITDFLVIAGIIIICMILWSLFRAKKKELPQKLLMLFFITLLSFLLTTYAELHNLPILFVLTFLLSFCIEVFLGPLVYLYIKSLFQDNKSFLKRNWFHFLPFLGFLTLVTIPLLYYIFTDVYLFQYLEYLNEDSSIPEIILMSFLIAYVIASLQLFNRYSHAMESNFSTIDENNFKWVKKMLIGALSVSVISLSITLYDTFISEIDWDIDYITMISLCIWIGYLGYYGVNQTKILLPDFLIERQAAAKTNNSRSNPLANTSEAELNSLKTSLISFLENDKPYLEEELNLSALANQLDTTDKKLSTLLNQYMNTTFYDLINSYRVASVKEKMASDKYDGLTLLGIAYESGFKSKTSFNRIFKKETGKSPSEYKKSL